MKYLKGLNQILRVVLDDDLYDLPSSQLICYYRSCSELKTVFEFSLSCL